MKEPRHNGTTRGFSRAASLMQTRIRQASETRGFAVSRVVTHWPEVVGPSIAAISKPVDVSYGRQGLGATLTVLTTGANAPMLEMQKEQIRSKVNACYGHNAIQRVRITHTAPVGFADGQVAFDHAKQVKPSQPDPTIVAEAREIGSHVGNETLRQALETLATNVLSRQKVRGTHE